MQREIALPLGAPGVLCLYADFRPGQLDTLVYLCNAGLDALSRSYACELVKDAVLLAIQTALGDDESRDALTEPMH